MAWLGTWAKRVKLTIDNTDITSALSNFPILIYLSSSCGRNNEDLTFVFDELQLDANRFKIAVTTSNGTTECYVEIEEWDDANEEAWLHVKVPAVASGSNTDLYLYYDASQPNNTMYVGDPNSVAAENVWDVNFVFVSHMLDDPDNANIRDSTSNDNDGAKNAANQPIVTVNGQISDAQNFGGTPDKIEVTDHASLDIIGDLTIETWLNSDAAPDATLNIIASKWVNDANNPYHYGYTGAATKLLRIRFGGVNLSSTDAITFGAWTYVVVTRDVSTKNVYFYEASAEDSGNPVAYLNNGTVSVQNLFIGKHPTAVRYLKGYLDELRISNVKRNNAWIKASYESQRDDLLDFGSQELMPVEPTGAFPIPRRRRRRRFTYTIPVEATVRRPFNLTFPMEATVRKAITYVIPMSTPIRRRYTEKFTAKRFIVNAWFRKLLGVMRQYVREEKE